MTALAAIAAHLDALLAIPGTPDYPQALNGVQVGHRGPVRRIATAVDCSLRAIEAAAGTGANLLVVHHGLFWGGLRPLAGTHLARVRALLDADLALISIHLPLDSHAEFGNSSRLARELGLTVSAGFARFESIDCGVRGNGDEETGALIARVTKWAAAEGHHTVASRVPAGHRTRRWGICSGAGANADTLREAYAANLDLLIVGEGPHWSAVEAEEHGLVIVYAGHYATETPGVRAIGAHLSAHFDLPWSFVPAPTGL